MNGYSESYKLEKETKNGWMCYGTYIDLNSATLSYADKIGSNPEKTFRIVKETRNILIQNNHKIYGKPLDNN
jgi:hypothetical protein